MCGVERAAEAEIFVVLAHRHHRARDGFIGAVAMAKGSAEHPRESGLGWEPRVQLSPLPDVADQIEHAVRGRALRKESYRRCAAAAAFRTLASKWVPFVAPWICAALGAARCTLPFQRARQPATAPGGIPPGLLERHPHDRMIEPIGR